MSLDKYRQAMYVINKQTENPYVRQDKELLSKRISVREVYRVKYMVALTAEKPENYTDILKEERWKLIENKKGTWGTDSWLLKISQVIAMLPLSVMKKYLVMLRQMQKMKQRKKKSQWIRSN